MKLFVALSSVFILFSISNLPLTFPVVGIEEVVFRLSHVKIKWQKKHRLFFHRFSIARRIVRVFCTHRLKAPVQWIFLGRDGLMVHIAPIAIIPYLDEK